MLEVQYNYKQSYESIVIILQTMLSVGADIVMV